jgi:chromosome segregation ATPase
MAKPFLNPEPRRVRPPAPLAGETVSAGDFSADALGLDRLRAENEELHAQVAELKRVLDSSSQREKELEQLLDEKNEVIRTLHLKLQEVETQPKPMGNEEELLALSDELERERCQLEQERKQMEEERRLFKEDQQDMEKQMREMEVQMARERAELARQRNELQRLHNEIRHEIEAAQRDGLLNEKLRMLQRRHQEAANRKGAAPAPDEPPRPGTPNVSEPTPAPAPNKSSSIFRLFRKG